MNIGDKLTELRKQSGKTQQEVANILGVRKSAVGNWEKNRRNPNIENLIKLAELYNVSMSVIFGEETKDKNLNDILIDKIIDDLVDEGLLTQEQTFEELDLHTQQILLAALNRHIAKIIKNKKSSE